MSRAAAGVRDDPLLAGVLAEAIADRAAARLGGKTVRDLLPRHRASPPVADADADDHRSGRDHGRLRSRLVAVMKHGRLIDETVRAGDTPAQAVLL
jgi:hypothetical protein